MTDTVPEYRVARLELEIRIVKIALGMIFFMVNAFLITMPGTTNWVGYVGMAGALLWVVASIFSPRASSRAYISKQKKPPEAPPERLHSRCADC